MPHTAPDIAPDFLAYASNRMSLSAAEITRCTAQLSESKMTHRSGDYENSITNLLLHLEGNIRQWILHGLDNQPDIRRRDEEFALAPNVSAAEAQATFLRTLDEAARVIAAYPPHRLLTTVDPQPTGTDRHSTVLHAIFKVVGHLQLHTGQIILLTKQLLQRDLDLTMPRKR